MSWLKIFLVFIGSWLTLSAIIYGIQWVYGLWVDGAVLALLEFINACVGAFVALLYAVENEIKV